MGEARRGSVLGDAGSENPGRRPRVPASLTTYNARSYTLSDIIITDYIVTDTSFHGHNYSRSTVSGKFFIFPTVNTNFRLKK